MNRSIKKKILDIANVIKVSLAMVMPVLFIGSITVLLNSFPVQVYQDFMDSFMGGALRNIVLILQATTSGILAIHLTIALNLSYINRLDDPQQKPVFRFASLMGCLTGFFILVGLSPANPDFSLLSGQGVFSALLAGIIGSVLYEKFESMFGGGKNIYIDGADSAFNAALHVILPFLCVAGCFAAANYLIIVCFDVSSVQHLFMKLTNVIFAGSKRSYSSGLLFTCLTCAMWWFGIHGNNVLNQVAEDMFTEIIPGEIVSKSFIDTFVNMGGTGCLIGLLLAMIVFGKRSSTKKLSGMALLPGIFNIGELFVFGFPVIYNPTLVLPFILAPMLCFSNAYLLTSVGFMPQVTNSVVWTTPALMSGYLATGSYRGVMVQMLNILISAACYAPFVVRYEKRSQDVLSSSMDELVEILKKNQELSEEVVLTDLDGNVGRLAKLLATDLDAVLSVSSPDDTSEKQENPLLLKYQPQYDANSRCFGAETLLRWEHKRFGTIYPPLVIQLAKENGDLFRLESYIIEKCVRDSEGLRRSYDDSFKLSVNVTAVTLCDRRFVGLLQDIADHYMLRAGNICLEITEETELALTVETAQLMEKIRNFGFTFALDDFSMGHTSLQYLQHNHFDYVKLDGSLVKSILDNERTREIISSIVYLSKSLEFKVIAEFVETVEQKDELERIGCVLYQGYLFSPAVDKEMLIGMGGTDMDA